MLVAASLQGYIRSGSSLLTPQGSAEVPQLQALLGAGGVKSALHQGSSYTLNPARSRKLEGRNPQCGHSVLSGAPNPSRSLLLPKSSAAVPSSGADTSRHSHSVAVKNIK